MTMTALMICLSHTQSIVSHPSLNKNQQAKHRRLSQTKMSSAQDKNDRAYVRRARLWSGTIPPYAEPCSSHACPKALIETKCSDWFIPKANCTEIKRKVVDTLKSMSTRTPVGEVLYQTQCGTKRPKPESG